VKRIRHIQFRVRRARRVLMPQSGGFLFRRAGEAIKRVLNTLYCVSLWHQRPAGNPFFAMAVKITQNLAPITTQTI